LRRAANAKNEQDGERKKAMPIRYCGRPGGVNLENHFCNAVCFLFSVLPAVMTLVAINAVVNVASDIPVFRVGGSLRVTIGALEYRVVIGIRMASRAHAVGVAMVDVEISVIEGSALPRCRVVTSDARGREFRSRVIRIGGGQIGRFMTTVAIRR
jgi:hypothetical protein